MQMMYQMLQETLTGVKYWQPKPDSFIQECDMLLKTNKCILEYIFTIYCF